jgi:DNA-directed RNA polymerase specialized sigma subunit
VLSIHASVDGAELTIAAAEVARLDPNELAALHRGLDALRPMERLAVERCIGHGEPLRVVAEMCGVSHQRVQQVQARALAKLAALLDNG